MTTTTSPRVRRRRDRDPVRDYPDGRVAYWTGGVAGEGRRVFTRPRPGQSVDDLVAQLRRDLGNPSLDKGDRTVMQLFLAWRESQPADHPTTRKIRSVANNHILPTVGLVRLRDLALADLLGVVDRALDKGRKKNTVHGIITSFASVVSWGRARGWFGPEHPFGPAETRRVAIERVLNRHYDALLAEEPHTGLDSGWSPTPAEVESLAVFFDELSPGAGHHIRVLAAAGLRVAEYVGLRTEDVDLERMQLRLRRQGRRDRPWHAADPADAGDEAWTTRLKGRHRRTVQVWESARDSLTWLVEHARDGWLVPPSTGQDWWLDAFNKAINAGCEAQGWPARRRCHALRHFYGTYGVAAEPVGYGFDVVDVSRWMGHSSVSYTQNKYVHATGGADERARQRSARKLC
jgi:integrase